MTTIWSFGSFAFFLIPFYLSSMKANIYYLSLSTEAAELLASIICLFIAHVMDLRRALFMCCCIVLAGCIAMMIATKISDNSNDGKTDMQDNLISSVLIMLTNLGVVIAFDVAYLKFNCLIGFFNRIISFFVSFPKTLFLFTVFISK